MAETPNLELLRTFVAAEAAPTLSAAAAARRVTKSAVSQQLKVLEAQLGVTLFERVGRHVRPTDAARALATSLRAAFASIDDSLDGMRAAERTVRGEVRVGAPRPFASFWVRPRLPPLLAAHPELTLDLGFGVPSELERRLVAGELDLAVLVRGAESDAVVSVPLFVETFVAVASPAYLRTHGTPHDAASFGAHRFVVFDRDLAMHAPWWRAAFGLRAAVGGRVTCRVASLDEMRALAVAGAGIAVLPEYFVAGAIASGELRAVAPAAGKARGARNAIVLAWRRAATDTARLRAVRDALTAPAPPTSLATTTIEPITGAPPAGRSRIRGGRPPSRG